MSKLLEALLADGRAATHKCAFPWTHAEWLGAGNVNFYSGTDGYVAFELSGVLGEAAKGERLTRAEFDAALKQYPSPTQGGIVQPEPNHAFLEHILKVTESSNADEACEKYLELLEESVCYVTLLEILGVGEGGDPVQYAEALKHNNKQLIRAAKVAESALTGLLDKMGCKGTGEALEKYRAGLKAVEERDEPKHATAENPTSILTRVYEALGAESHHDPVDHIKRLVQDEKSMRRNNRSMRSALGLRDGEHAIAHINQLKIDRAQLKWLLSDTECDTAEEVSGKFHQMQDTPVSPSATQANLLHDGQLYRNATVLLHTEQLIVWRDADEQEHSAPAHQVTLNPDDNGLAAAILSRIGSYEVAPEHIAEMRQQMGWNDEA